MNLLREIKRRFRRALETLVEDSTDALELIRPAQDPRFGDYQANCAMPLGKQLGRPPRELADQIVRRLQLDDLCLPPEVAGPGFINLRLRDESLAQQLQAALRDDRLAVPLSNTPRTYVIDYSAPNVAKPMHVGHIRSTVIGDALCRTLRFLGHSVIADNHLGDWGTQFGMVIYGYRHFLDPAAYEREPVAELGRIYRVVRQIMDYQDAVQQRPRLQQQLDALRQQVQQSESQPAADKEAQKLAAKALKKLRQWAERQEQLESLTRQIAAWRTTPLWPGRQPSIRRSNRPCCRRPHDCTPVMPTTSGSGSSSCPSAARKFNGSTIAWRSRLMSSWERVSIRTASTAWSPTCGNAIWRGRARARSACSCRASRRP